MAKSLTSIVLGLLALGLAACQSVAPASQSGTAYLVRHAEKTAERPDPGLTAEGQARAETLADELTDAGITAIWSTDYLRTRATAAPLAERLGLPVQVYDPRDLEGFAALLQTDPAQIVLVVGHSNTTPQLAGALGGDPGSPIEEATEYDRLYVISLATGASTLRRYGTRFVPQETDEQGQ